MTVAKCTLMENHALVVSGLGDLALKPWPLNFRVVQGQPEVPEGNVLVKVKATGICGSDIHYWKDGRVGFNVVTAPVALGHECAGEIVGIGDKVKDWKLGDRVAIEPSGPCGMCFDCTTGASNVCPNVRQFGVPGCDGSAMTYKVVPQRQLVRLTPNLSWVEAGVIQPLAISVHTCRQAGNFAQKTVAILGGGCIGSFVGRLAKHYGALKVVIVEILDHRVQFVKEFGSADHVFQNPPRDASEKVDAYGQRVSKQILDSIPGLNRGFDIVIEASGAEDCMNIGLRLVRPNATFVQLGVHGGKDIPQIPMMVIMARQLNVRGSFRYTTNCFQEAVGLIERGIVPVKEIISHVYHLDRSVEAFEAVHRVQDKAGRKCLKIVILHEEEEVDEFWKAKAQKQSVTNDHVA